MRLKTLAGLLCALLLVAGSTLLQHPSEAKAQRSGAGRQTINATVIGIGGRYARSYPFRLIINSYTSPGDVQRLNDALQSGGQEELLRALSGMDSGRIAIGNNVGVTANAVISTPAAEGGNRLVVLYERNVNIYELRRGARSADYRFGYAEIFLDAQGRGEGTLIPAAKVRLRDGNIWEVEDFGIYPARIMGARATGNVPAR